MVSEVWAQINNDGITWQHFDFSTAYNYIVLYADSKTLGCTELSICQLVIKMRCENKSIRIRVQGVKEKVCTYLVWHADCSRPQYIAHRIRKSRV